MNLSQPVFERISIRQLQTFVLVYELGSLVKTAHRLSITQPAVTKRLRELERDLAVTLFQRAGRGVAPTAFADALFEHAGTVLATLRAAEGAIDAIRDGDGGSVIVGVSPVASKLVARAVIALRRDRPNIHVRIESGSYETLVGWIDAGDIDMAIARFGNDANSKRLDRAVLAEEPLTVLARADHPAAAIKPRNLAELADFEWVLPTPNEIVRPEIDDAFRDAGISELKRLVETTSISTTRELIAHGNALTISPRLIYLDDFESGFFTSIPVNLPIQLNPIAVTWRRTPAMNPPAHHLMTAIETVAAELQ
jgi:DNA-binding transcriptional LysR family regulator